MTRPRRALAAACAAAATAGGHIADTDAADRCTLPGARVIRQDSRAKLLLVRVKGDNPRRYYGCLRNHAPRLLAQEYNPRDVDAGEFHRDFRLAGVTVAWNEFDYDGSGYGSRSFTLHLRTLGGGRGTDITTYDDDNGPTYGYPGRLALGADGALAWTLEPDSDNEDSSGATEILGVPAGSTRLVPLGAEFDVVQKSLRVANGRATWREQDGTRHAVPIAPPPPPLLPAPSGDAVGPQGLDPRFGPCGFRDLTPKKAQFTQGAVVPTAAGGAIAAGGTYSDTLYAVRLTADGALDTAFGTGGMVSTKLPKVGKLRPDQIFINHLISEPDGGIVLAGNAGLYKPGDDPFGTVRPLLVRYDAAGRLDPAFGGDGIVHGVLVGKGDDSVTNLALAPDGGLLATVSGSKGRNLVRIRPDGTIDPAFGRNGRVPVPVTAGLDVAQDGSITVAGSTGDRIELVRYGPTGARLSSAGADLPGSAGVAGLAPLVGGGFLVAGSVSGFVTKDHLVQLRFTPDGDLDTTFGRAGVLDDPSVGPASDVLSEPDGGWLVAAKNGLARYAADGLRDTSFGRGGLLLSAPLDALAPGPDGTVVAMWPDSLSFERFALAEPAVTATAAAAPVCEYQEIEKHLYDTETSRRVVIDADFVRPGTYTGTATLLVGSRSFPLGTQSSFIPGVDDFRVPWNVGPAARRALAKAGKARVKVTIGVDGGPSTTDTLLLKG